MPEYVAVAVTAEEAKAQLLREIPKSYRLTSGVTVEPIQTPGGLIHRARVTYEFR